MQRDVYTSPPGGQGYTEPSTERPTPSEERGAVDYILDFFDGVRHWTGRAVRLLAARPIALAAVGSGIIGAIAGMRLAQYQAAQSRRERTARAMSRLAAVLYDTVSRGQWYGRGAIRERGEDLMESTRGLAGSMAGRLPRTRRRAGGMASSLQQIGSAMSLIPIAVTLLRNPTIRGMGTRLVTRLIWSRAPSWFR